MRAFLGVVVMLAGCSNLLGFDELQGIDVDAIELDGTADGPNADGPDVDAPAVDAPMIDGPPVDAPATDAPMIDAPMIDAPPPIDAPMIDAPMIDAPPSQYMLTVARNGTGSGTVVSAAPAGAISCGTDCTHSIVGGTVVTLTATPAAGSTFAGWAGPCSGTGACTFGLNAATAVTATFTLNSYTVTLQKSGTGQGVVTSSPSGIACNTSCASTTASFTHGATVTLSPTADAASDFIGWSGPSCPGRTSCTFTVTSNVTVTAGFMQPWTVLVDGPFAGGDDRGAGIAADPSGNILAGGFTSRGPTAGLDEDLWVRKLTPTGTPVWTDVYMGAGSETARGMAASATHVYVSGYSYLNATNARDIYLRRFTATGAPDAPVTVNGLASGNDIGTRIALDAAGNVYVAGQVTTSSGIDGWVAKYSSALVLQWSRTYDGPASGTDIFWGIAVDAAGNAYVAGWHTTANGLDAVLRKYDPDGNAPWTQTYNHAGLDDWGYGVAVDSAGFVYMSSTVTAAAGNTDVIVQRYAPTGGPATWTNTYAGGAIGETRDLVSCNDNLYAIGFFDAAGQGTNIWLRRLTTAGATVWDRTHGGTLAADDVAQDAACDAAGNLLVTGWVDRPTNGQIWIRKYYQ